MKFVKILENTRILGKYKQNLKRKCKGNSKFFFENLKYNGHFKKKELSALQEENAT